MAIHYCFQTFNLWNQGCTLACGVSRGFHALVRCLLLGLVTAPLRFHLPEWGSFFDLLD